MHEADTGLTLHPRQVLCGVLRAAILFLVAPDVFWSDCLRIGLTSLPVVDSKEVFVFCDIPQHIT